MSIVSIASHVSWSTYDTFFIVLLSGRPVYDQNPLRPNPNLQKLVSCSCRIRGLGQTLTPLVLARWSWHNPHEGAPTTICYLNLISSIDYSIGRGDFKEVLKKHTKKKNPFISYGIFRIPSQTCKWYFASLDDLIFQLLWFRYCFLKSDFFFSR